MLIRKKSAFSGIERIKEIPITEDQYNNWINGMVIQKAAPNLSENDREFLVTGITEEEWDSILQMQK